jgi:hypothetical protein
VSLDPVQDCSSPPVRLGQPAWCRDRVELSVVSGKRTLHYAHGEPLSYDQFRQALAILCAELSAAAPVNGMGKLVNHRARRIPSFHRKGNIVLATTHTKGKGVPLESPNENSKADSYGIPALQ